MTRFFRIFWLLPLVAATATFSFGQTATNTQSATKRAIVPGEQAPRAEPGQRNFGGPAPGAGMGARRGGAPGPRGGAGGQDVSLEQISMSDPYVFPDDKSRTYYLTGTGGRLYKGKDLKTWSAIPGSVIDLTGTWMNRLFVAAAEIHHIGDKYYYAGTWSDHSVVARMPQLYEVDDSGDKLILGKRYSP